MSGLQAGRAHGAGALLVKFRDGAPASLRGEVRQGVGARKLETVRGGKGELALMKLPAVMPIADGLRALRSHPAVEYAELNGIHQHIAAANDAY